MTPYRIPARSDKRACRWRSLFPHPPTWLLLCVLVLVLGSVKIICLMGSAPSDAAAPTRPTPPQECTLPECDSAVSWIQSRIPGCTQVMVSCRLDGLCTVFYTVGTERSARVLHCDSRGCVP